MTKGTQIICRIPQEAKEFQERVKSILFPKIAAIRETGFFGFGFDWDVRNGWVRAVI